MKLLVIYMDKIMKIMYKNKIISIELRMNKKKVKIYFIVFCFIV